MARLPVADLVCQPSCVELCTPEMEVEDEGEFSEGGELGNRFYRRSTVW